jgi:LAO/AO transport system kinase
MALSPLAQGVLDGDVRSAARLMRRLDDQQPDAEQALRELYPHTGKAWLIGITGSPGAGKSTLTSRLIGAFREQGKKVGVVAIDPTSPFSGGAILGDRIRMQAYDNDPDVFIRSCATRGAMGGLSQSTSNVVRVLDAFGKDVIIIETVGVGQDEVEIVSAAHTTLVVTVPGMGDDIQAIKAGILEIADLFVVNKADREGADRTVRDLQIMLEMNAKMKEGWFPPILKTVAAKGDGVPELVAKMEQHRAELQATDGITRFNRERSRREFMNALQYRLYESAKEKIASEGGLDGLLDRISAGQADPFSIAEEIAGKLLK